MSKDKYNPRRHIIKKLEREYRHDRRALEEHSKFLTTIEFIDSIFIYYPKGNEDEPKRDFIVSFNLVEPILYKDFSEFLHNKLGGSVIESI